MERISSVRFVVSQFFKGNQPVQATISHAKKKRRAHHYFCGGGKMTVVGSPRPGIVEVRTYGK
jgi:hypothetical protein